MSEQRLFRFDEIAQLAGNTGLAGQATTAFSVREAEGFFVSPLFVPTHEGENARVTLISARGAAGKSATANALSTHLQAPVWRLEDEKAVGYTSVRSVLSIYLRTVDPEAEISKLPAPIVIVDSVDEARSRVSASSWEEFVQALISAIDAGLRMIITGRNQTITDLWVRLEDAGVVTRWFEVSHFDAASCETYIDKRCQEIKPDANPTNSAYLEARLAVLNALRQQVDSSESARFVGYPPVLDAVATLLAGANLQAVVNDFQNKPFERRTEVLEQILLQLLARERDKFLPSFDNLGIADKHNCYSVDEQHQWLLHDLEGTPQPELSYILDPDTKSEYIKRAKTFLDDHPFRSNTEWSSPVFRAYAVWSLFDQLPGAITMQTGDGSGMLYEFASGLSEDQILVNEANFAALHLSLLAGLRHDASVEAAVIGDDAYRGELAMQSGEITTSIEVLIVPEEPDQLVLFGPLAFLSIRSPGKILVRTREPEPILGPDLEITCDVLDFRPARVSFERRDDSPEFNEVHLEASENLTLPSEIAGKLPPAGTVEIAPPQGTRLRYPWVTYQIAAETPYPRIDPRAVRFLTKLMNLTRSHGHSGDRAVFSKKFEGRQGLRTEDFQRAMDVLRRRGVIYQKSDMIFVSESWEKYRFYGKSGGSSQSLDNFLHAWEPVLLEITEELAGPPQ